ncbi:hypothetical protein AB1L42_05440 [Thalassoglobus sp. JC818]|uniref:hypothetical protein n=1 Tax=Thalassoglobus sp. JC818 TaxID=3232136 RepID=UPI003457871D
MGHCWFLIFTLVASPSSPGSPLEVEHFHFDGDIKLSAVSTDTFEMRVFRVDKDSSIPHSVGIYSYQPGGTDKWASTDYVRWECAARLIPLPHGTTEVFGDIYLVNDGLMIFIRRIDWKQMD